MNLSGLEIQHRFAAFQIDRHRDVVVRIQPSAFDLTKAAGEANSHVGLLTVLQSSADPFEAGGAGDIVACDDVHVAKLDLNWTFVLGEELLVVFPISVCSDVLERRHDVVRHHFRRVERHNPVNVVGAECFRPAV